MARLNDPPVPVESIDALKRRFIRQNREIARVNSTQSLRIRNLETEISRLLSENITLREKAIAAAQEADRWRHAHHLGADVVSMKQRLEAKLQEVGILVQELGGLPEKAARRTSSSRRQSLAVELVKSPNERDWRNRQTIGGVLTGDREMQEGRLPPIMEDKHYPRRTLETTEIRSMLDDAAIAQASESPDLGPPPVAHFEVAEPVNFNAGKPLRELPMGVVENNDIVPLPRHLETRRKRRTSSLLQDMSAVEPQAAKSDEQQPSLLKSGAKRKLDVSELENAENEVPIEKDDFVFQRKPVTSATSTAMKRGSRFSRPSAWQPQDSTANTSSPQKELQQPRKVLAPKSANSPSKRRVQVGEKPSEKGETGAPRIQKPTARVGFRNEDIKTHDLVLDQREDAENKDVYLPPKTPAGLDDLFSPISTEPSVKNDSRPQEAAVLNSVEDVLNGSIGRGSRRARAAVSYAEPNLRDKMRRPGKELVGAVEGIDRTRESSGRGTSTDRFSQSEEVGAEILLPSNFTVKQECGKEDDKWKTLPMASKKEEPTSPLGDKERSVDHKQDRIRAKADPQHRDDVGSELDNAVSRLSIFDPPTSSPAEDGKDRLPLHQNAPATSTAKRRQPSAAVRRHSMAPSTQISNASIMKSNTATATLPSSSTSVPARPSSAASVRSDSSKAGVELKRSNSVNTARRERDDAAMAAAESRNERIASRRRSMMV